MTQRLGQLDDMSVECEHLCEQETPAKSHDLRTQLAALKEDTGQLKLDAYRKQDLLKDALKVRMKLVLARGIRGVLCEHEIQGTRSWNQRNLAF